MPGQIGWIDLTIPDAPALRDFYSQVAGWTVSEIKMGDYSDYCMTPAGEADAVAGICHARGANAAQPAAWMIYITVDNLDQSMERCRELHGEILRPPASAGPSGRFCVIKDPAGAICALYEAPASA
jgi:uncharacterized protein